MSLLRSITGLHLAEAWGPETGNCKTREILHFLPFLWRSLTEETGYKRPELDVLMGLASWVNHRNSG